jgi:NADH-dependent peroxiredoxin subunit F
MTATTEAKERYDVVIIGAGPAGLTAGMYAARQGLSTAIVAGEVGGQASWAKKIENYMGWQVITGPELVARFREHISAFDVDCFEGQLVNAVVPSDDGFEVYTREGARLVARALIIAAGRAPNRLAVPGEADLVGRGVSYCATCDGAFFAGKPAAVVGPGESAADAALQLAALGADVTLISSAPVKAPQAVLDKIEADSRITVRTGTKVVRIEGNDTVTGLTVRALGPNTPEETLDVEGVFIETGSIPAAEFTGGLVETNERGEIIVDETGATSARGIYAAGDVTNGLGKQVIIAAGAGARAAIAADHDLNRR